MDIPQEELDRFKAIYKKNFGKDISNKEALKLGTDLCEFIKLVYKSNEAREI